MVDFYLAYMTVFLFICYVKSPLTGQSVHLYIKQFIYLSVNMRKIALLMFLNLEACGNKI